MTITATESEISYAGNGVTVAFAIPFAFDTSSDLKVTSTDSIGTISELTTGWATSGGAGSTGTLTFTTAPASGVTITILDDPDITQPTDYTNNDAFPAESHEIALDRQTRISKRLYQYIKHCLRTADGDPIDGDAMVLGSVSTRKGKYLFFNAVTGAIEYAVALATTTLSQSIIGQLLNPQTANESAAGVTPTNYWYAEGNAKRYGATGDGVTNDTTALSNWLSVAVRCGFGYLPKGTYKATTLTLTLTGTRITNSVTLYGDGRTMSNITKISGANALLTITSSAPNSSLAVLPIVVRDIGFFGAAKLAGSKALALNSLAQFRIENVQIDAFDTGVSISSSLIGSFVNCEVTGNNNGYLFSYNATLNVYNNLVTIEYGRINNNTTYGVDVGSADLFTMRSVDMEANGTAANVNTGAIIVRATCDDEIGLTQIYIDKCWLEGNLGRGINIEAGMSNSFFEINGGHIINQELGRALVIQSGRRVSIEGLMSPSAGDTWDITCDQLFLKNCLVTTLTDTNVTYPHYIFVQANTTTYYEGRVYTWTATLTGCTAVVTATVSSVKQGNTVRHNAPDILGTSNAVGCTVTGMPAYLRPPSSKNLSLIIEDNGIDDSSYANVASSGVVTLTWRGGNFTAAGSKGIRAGEWPAYSV